jgi:hypothetical protein
MLRMVEGPFDGAHAEHGDPGAPSIWPTWRDGGIVYATRPKPGRPRYDRLNASRYVYGDAADRSYRLDLEALA